MPRPDRHRAALVRSAAGLLRRQGYAATSLTQVLAAAGAPNGSLYHHFPGGKEELAIAAVQAAGQEIARVLRAALDDAAEPAEAVATWVTALVAALQTDFRDGCPVAAIALEAPASSDALRRAAAAAFETWTDALRDRLIQDRPADLADRQARAILAAIEGALLLDRTGRRTDHLVAVAAAAPTLLARPAERGGNS